MKCQPVDTARSRVKGAGFEVVVSDTKVASSCPAGTAAGTSPGNRTIKGGVVTIEVSSGGGATPPSGGTTPPGNNPGRPGTGRPGG
ncbi:hypothetical protein GCM10027614_52100 [Micromonospora vulcania]